MNKAIDLSHHLSDLANARQVSPLKGLQKYFKPDAIQFAGGEHLFVSSFHLWSLVSHVVALCLRGMKVRAVLGWAAILAGDLDVHVVKVASPTHAGASALVNAR